MGKLYFVCILAEYKKVKVCARISSTQRFIKISLFICSPAVCTDTQAEHFFSRENHILS